MIAVGPDLAEAELGRLVVEREVQAASERGRGQRGEEGSTWGGEDQDYRGGRGRLIGGRDVDERQRPGERR